MCATCGCDGTGAVLHRPNGQHGHGDHEHGDHEHGDHEHGDHRHEHLPAADSRTIVLQRKILAKNDAIAHATRKLLAARGVLMLNLMGSPGAGKTALLERTARDLAGEFAIAVIEGDQETTLDADRISAAGCQVVQINTGAGCHLDAQMVASGLTALDPPPGTIVVVENVGNLVCPALFDLGEGSRVVLSSVTEGADKPVKYPQMFRVADLVAVTKIDLLPYLDFDRERHAADIGRLSPAATRIEVSAVSSAGLEDWYHWLAARRPQPPGPG